MSIPTELSSAVADRYVIEREIGRGGVATVYLAEIRITANLQHPNLLPLFDSGEVNGQPYMSPEQRQCVRADLLQCSCLTRVGVAEGVH